MCIEMKFIFFVLYVLQFLPFALLHKLADLTGLLAYLLVKPAKSIWQNAFPSGTEKSAKPY